MEWQRTFFDEQPGLLKEIWPVPWESPDWVAKYGWYNFPEGLWALDPENELVWFPLGERERWLLAFGSKERNLVGLTKAGDVEVRTEFVGINQRPSPWGPPLLFVSTMIGDPLLAGSKRCYATWAQAEIGHQFLVDKFAKWQAESAAADWEGTSNGSPAPKQPE